MADQWTERGDLLALGAVAILAGIGIATRRDPLDLIPGGRAAGRWTEGLDPQEMAVGMWVERQHTPDPRIAFEIDRDHLVEDPRYYTHLLRMQRLAGVQGG